jgi:hypothetical protein
MLRDHEITKFFEYKKEENGYRDGSLRAVKQSSPTKPYDTLKTYKEKIYTGMKIGGEHYWNYNEGKWYEVKKTPEKWKFTFNSLKSRTQHAPPNSGAHTGTKYHWFIIADQIAEKLDANTYATHMKGVKYKVGHKREYWKKYSYKYEDQKSYKELVIQILENTLESLKKG